MLKAITIPFLAFLGFFAGAQTPLQKSWDVRFGGAEHDYLTSFQATADGGYILGGYSESGRSGDKTEPIWGSQMRFPDFWLVKIDANGNKQWDKRYGGTASDWLYSLQQTADGGYILGGASSSANDGDKTEFSRGGYDYWIVKIDSYGNKQWDKRFGSPESDILLSLDQTRDGGYILGGTSNSFHGGDKTAPGYGYLDYWIIKTDSLGNKVWDKTYGGSKIEELRSIKQTPDGGFILGGYSKSGISGDKTQANWDPGIGYTTHDYWIIKIDEQGNKQWDKRYGGTEDDKLFALDVTDDRGYILGGISESQSSGDKSEASRGYSDYWIIKLDSLGNKQWDKIYGGLNTEYFFGTISQTIDGQYLLVGTSDSDAGGDKSQDNFNLNHAQIWALEIDSIGNKIWDRTLLSDGLVHGGNVNGTEGKITGYAVQTGKNCYAIASSTTGGIGGDKSQPNRDTLKLYGSTVFYDYWIIKFCDCSDLDVITSVSPVSCYGGSDGRAKVIPSGGVEPYSYVWNDGDTTDSRTFSSGTYSVTISDLDGCKTSIAISIGEGSPCTGINNILEENIIIHQNTTNSKVIVTSTMNEEAAVTLTDAIGRTVLTQHHLFQRPLEINIGEFRPGIYFLNIRTTASEIVRKVVKY